MTAEAGAGPEALEHFGSFERQRGAALLGMWVFLANELLLFGGLFMTALILRLLYPEAVMEAATHLKWWLGGINSVVLITSSLTMSFAIEAARELRQQETRNALLGTAALGFLFLGIKTIEYWLEYEEGLMPFLDIPYALPDPATRLYINLYFIATGLHGAHLLIGIGILLVMWLRVRRPDFLRLKPTHIEVCGLYWHFVDLIWMFLFATLYLVNRH